MKNFQILMIVGVFLLINTFHTLAQPSAAPLQAIDSYPLYITYFKTTSIIFPQAIVSVDRGSKDILVQKAKGVDNILQVKAARDSFPETNLTVVTADGKLNSFVLNYTEQPAVLNLSLLGQTPRAADTAFFSSENANQATLQAGAKAAYVTNKKVHGIKDNDFGIRFQMNGLFIHEDVLYFRIKIENESNISYDIDQLRFFIRDQKKPKRTATQEVEVKPLYIYNDTEKVKGQTQQIMVFALPKFTIPDKKKLIIQFMEAHGGRHLEVKVKNKTIVKASVLTF